MTLDLIWARNPSRHSYYSSPINELFHPQKQKLYFFSSFLKPPKAPHLLSSTRTSIPTSQRKTLIRCEWLCLPPVGLPCCLYLYLTVIMKNLGPFLSKPCILPCIPSPLNSRICILLLSPFCPALTLSPVQLGHLTYTYIPQYLPPQIKPSWSGMSFQLSHFSVPSHSQTHWNIWV